ncbi:hypothetical protein TM902_580004 [Tenacibaculum maritimum]|uniref:hypothetical protein n=2 Tax=Tenacibaculum maritimum TaxID=107401 RepID=UPI0012E497C2|nr:hypothetical protein [Tenacibaculum maritimum]CAA0204627.1 hypothetical protein JIP32914_260004 [Tenacibaculum maritimum]CAA0204724.1 hypothetical protein TM902_580004 [Tenacibaculum maritimum]CAA0238015.1 hypothetical protein DPIF8902391_540003 [Tenacibaculum maritimum]
MKKTIYLIVLVFLFNCEKSLDKSYTFLIRNPYGCTHFFKIKDNGVINYTVGADKNYIEEFSNFEIEYNKIIGIEKDKEIYSYIDSITSNFSGTKSKFSKDAFHYQLYRGDSLLVDSYADDSEINNEIKNRIINILKPKKIDFFCESY